MVGSLVVIIIDTDGIGKYSNIFKQEISSGLILHSASKLNFMRLLNGPWQKLSHILNSVSHNQSVGERSNGG